MLSRQFADDLSHEDRETLKNLVAELRTQHSQIQRIYGKLSESLNTYIQSDDVRQSVSLRKVLAEAEQAIRSMPYERDRPGLVRGPALFNAGFESLAMVKLFDPDEFATPPRLADPIAFSDSDRVRSARTGKARPEVVRAAMQVQPRWATRGKTCPPKSGTSTPCAPCCPWHCRPARLSTGPPGNTSTSNKSTAASAPRTCLSSR